MGAFKWTEAASQPAAVAPGRCAGHAAALGGRLASPRLGGRRCADPCHASSQAGPRFCPINTEIGTRTPRFSSWYSEKAMRVLLGNLHVERRRNRRNNSNGSTHKNKMKSPEIFKFPLEAAAAVGLRSRSWVLNTQRLLSRLLQPGSSLTSVTLHTAARDAIGIGLAPARRGMQPQPGNAGLHLGCADGLPPQPCQHQRRPRLSLEAPQHGTFIPTGGLAARVSVDGGQLPPDPRREEIKAIHLHGLQLPDVSCALWGAHLNFLLQSQVLLLIRTLCPCLLRLTLISQDMGTLFY